MNTGIGDAVNLGWKLAAAVDGWAPPGLLEPVAPGPAAALPTGAAVDRGTGTVFQVDPCRDRVLVFAPRPGGGLTRVGVVPTGAGPVSVVFDARTGNVHRADHVGRSVTTISRSADGWSATQTTPLRFAPNMVAVDASGSVLSTAGDVSLASLCSTTVPAYGARDEPFVTAAAKPAEPTRSIGPSHGRLDGDRHEQPGQHPGGPTDPADPTDPIDPTYPTDPTDPDPVAPNAPGLTEEQRLEAFTDQLRNTGWDERSASFDPANYVITYGDGFMRAKDRSGQNIEFCSGTCVDVVVGAAGAAGGDGEDGVLRRRWRRGRERLRDWDEPACHRTGGSVSGSSVERLWLRSRGRRRPGRRRLYDRRRRTSRRRSRRCGR